MLESCLQAAESEFRRWCNMSSITSGGGGGDIDTTLKLGNTSVEHAEIDGANTSADAITEDRTIVSGDSHIHGNMTIGNGRTWTIDSGGSLLSLFDLTVSGTGVLINNGTAIAIS